MDAAEVAAKLRALEEGVSAQSSRIAGLETRVSLLEAENIRLRKAMPKAKGEDVVGVRNGQEEGMDVDANQARRADTLVGSNPPKRTGRTVTSESDDEDEIEESGGGGGRDHEIVHCDDNVGLEDDDVSVTPWGKKRMAARVITSDSEDEDGNDKDGEVQEEEEMVGVTPSRKRALRGASDSNSEDGSEGIRVVSPEHTSDVPEGGIESEDDDGMPIRVRVKKKREEKVSRDNGELGETKGYSTPAIRRSARLVESQSKRVQDACQVLPFADSEDCEESDDDLEEDNGMDEFIDDEDCSENSAGSAEESSAEPEECDSEVNYKDVMADIGRKRNVKAKHWEYEADMLSAFDEHPELRLKAVCALYRKQTEKRQSETDIQVHYRQGFNLLDAPRGSRIARFLLDSDTPGLLKRTADDLQKHDLEFCHKMALRYSKQLFAIYQNKEDPYFP